MVRAELDAADAPANIQSASQGSLRKRETTSSRGMSAPKSSADTQFRARGSSQHINESAVRIPEPYIHFEQFFAQYPRFQYDPSAPVSVQYKAMCRKYGFPPKSNYWEVKSELDLKADAARAGFRLAMSFCAVLDISPVPLTLEACRAAVRDVHVNLVDLVNWGMMGAEIRKFETLQELSTYTKDNGKFFPQSEAEAGGFLRFLLRPILRGLKGAYHG
ncbi:hypothetical protein K438DRAFT_1839567 [Mycena galopus ATCC 62051]|nr:hypothetical protein K438DRAFT_1839567 [Mycena galopus ATCC 62051]